MAREHPMDDTIAIGLDARMDGRRAATGTSRQPNDEPSLGHLFGELSRETSTLVRHEVRLAKVEMTRIASEAGKNVGFLALGGAVAYAGFLAILAALIIGLGLVLDNLWLSALLVGVIVAAVGALLVNQGLTSLKQLNFTPEETIESLKEDKEWLQRQV